MDSVARIKSPQPSDYWSVSKKPLISLVFIAPMLIFYEAGVLMLGQRAIRNGADVWLRTFLEWIGFGGYFLLPVLVCGILLAWHYLRRDPWRISPVVLGKMLLEATAFGLLLLAIAHLQGQIFGKLWFAVDGSIVAATGDGPGLFNRMIAYLGAGIYEELLFRLMLLPVAIMGLRAWGLSLQKSIIVGIVVVSLMFSAAHYRVHIDLGLWEWKTAYGDAWGLYSFTFRFLAGVFFSLLFAFRGFGIAAGSHAIYDLAVALS